VAGTREEEEEGIHEKSWEIDVTVGDAERKEERERE
jgi:hypothetical protein